MQFFCCIAPNQTRGHGYRGMDHMLETIKSIPDMYDLERPAKYIIIFQVPHIIQSVKQAEQILKRERIPYRKDGQK